MLADFLRPGHCGHCGHRQNCAKTLTPAKRSEGELNADDERVELTKRWYWAMVGMMVRRREKYGMNCVRKTNVSCGDF